MVPNFKLALRHCRLRYTEAGRVLHIITKNIRRVVQEGKGEAIIWEVIKFEWRGNQILMDRNIICCQ